MEIVKRQSLGNARRYKLLKDMKGGNAPREFQIYP
jgi:hypothetical protein